MKVLILLALVSQGLIANAGTPKSVQVPIEDVYAPAGFDSNDSSEIIITGFLPNLCHKAPKTEVVINGNNIDIKVTALHYHQTNPYQRIHRYQKNQTIAACGLGF